MQAKLTTEQQDQLIKLANGHPYSLRFFYALARDSPGFLAAEMETVGLSSLDSFVHHLLSKSFDSLTEWQRRILLVVALFECDGTLGAVCEIISTVSI